MLSETQFDVFVKLLKFGILLVFSCIILFIATTKLNKVKEKQKINVLSHSMVRYFEFPRIIVCPVDDRTAYDETESFESVLNQDTTPDVTFLSQNMSEMRYNLSFFT